MFVFILVVWTFNYSNVLTANIHQTIIYTSGLLLLKMPVVYALPTYISYPLTLDRK